MAEPQECAICLSKSPPAKSYGFSCNCSANVHQTCLQEWFNESGSSCIYCRTSTNITTPIGMVNPLEPVYNNNREHIIVMIPEPTALQNPPFMFIIYNIINILTLLIIMISIIAVIGVIIILIIIN